MLTTALTAIVTGCNLFQAQPAEPKVIGLTPGTGVAAQAVTGVTPGIPSVTVSFDTAMNQADTERAVALYPGEYNPATNPAKFTKPGLDTSCNGRWRVTNPNPQPISFNWDVSNTTQKGVGVAPANSNVFFQTSLGSNSVRLYVNGKQQQVSASNPAACSGNLFNFAWTTDYKNVTVIPAAPLTQGARYTMAVSTNAKSTAGVALGQPYAAGFVAQQQTSDRVTATLTPGGTIVGPDGMTITAPTNGFTGPAQITIKRLNQTEIESISALPSVKSNYYLITSEPEAYSTDEDFVIRIPVQQISSSEEYGGYVYGQNYLHSTQKFWLRKPVTEVEAGNYVKIFAGGFSKELGGFVYAVRSFPKAILGANLSAQNSSQGLKLACDTTITLTVIIPQQEVTYPCPKDLLQSLSILTQNEMNSLSQDTNLSSYGKRPIIDFVVLQNSRLTPCKDAISAFYADKAIWYCVDDLGNLKQSSAQIVKVVRHEVMHGIQKAFYNLGGRNTNWLTESTAEASIESNANQMKVSSYRMPKEVTRSLTESNTNGDDVEYRTQDFWVYFGNNLIGKGLSFYPQIFSSATAVSTGISNASGGQYTLASAYWAWAKNQAYEKSSDRTLLHPKFTSPECTVEVRTAPYAALFPTTFDFDSGRYTDTPSVAALTSNVYNFRFTNTKNRTLAVRFTGSGKFKAYMRSDQPNCPGGTDGAPGAWQLYPNRQDTNTLVVIVSNTGSGSGTLELEALNEPRILAQPSSNPLKERTRVNTTVTTSFPVKNVGTAPMNVGATVDLPANVSISVPSNIAPGASGTVSVSYACGSVWGKNSITIGVQALTIANEATGSSDSVGVDVDCTDLVQTTALLGFQNIANGGFPEGVVNVYSAPFDYRYFATRNSQELAHWVDQEVLTGGQVAAMLSSFTLIPQARLVGSFRTQVIDGCGISPFNGSVYFHFEAVCGMIEYEAPLP